MVCLVSDSYFSSGKIEQKPPEENLMIRGKTTGKLAKEGRIINKEKIGMECVYHRVTLEGRNPDL